MWEGPLPLLSYREWQKNTFDKLVPFFSKNESELIQYEFLRLSFWPSAELNDKQANKF
jgi:hypothetical protein